MARQMTIKTMGQGINVNLLPQAGDDNADNYYVNQTEFGESNVQLKTDIDSAQLAADNAQTTADHAITAADNAQTTANSVQTTLNTRGGFCLRNVTPSFTAGAFKILTGWTTVTNDTTCTPATDKTIITEAGRYDFRVFVMAGSSHNYSAGGATHAFILDCRINGTPINEGQHLNYDTGAGSGYRRPAMATFVRDLAANDVIECYYYLSDGTLTATIECALTRVK